ncbi:hypothetical protein GOODEAATRI_020994 [Goodea atripinnis]|uniref:Uncharacterized protein n=1 Tax=Goodea atripinnis TaxID=208336 RepID=A0ABV0NLZ0_9TELE
MNAGYSNSKSLLNFVACDRSYFGSKLKSHVCLPARRHSHVLPFLSGSFPKRKRPPCWIMTFLVSSDSSSSWGELEWVLHNAGRKHGRETADLAEPCAVFLFKAKREHP